MTGKTQGHAAFAAALLLALALLPAAAAAAEPAAEAAKTPPGKIASLWVIWPQPGHEAQFLAAIKAHVAWRQQAGEPFRWTAYAPAVGDDLTHFVWRSGGHQWAELDADTDWGTKNQAGEKFDAEIGPHVGRIEHYLTEDDLDHTYWHEGVDYRYFQVEDLQLRPGARGEMIAALDKVQKAAVDGKWPQSYSVSWTIGGSGGMTVVFPYRNYADMAEPSPSFMQVLAKSLGSEEAAGAAMKQLNASFESGSHTTIYVVRPDLSTPK